MAYVLIVVMLMSGPTWAISMQDFTSKETCEAAKALIVANAKRIVNISCVVK
jgi:hypothetical protein